MTQNELKQLLHYSPKTGLFVWRVNRGRVRAGDKAGTMNYSEYDSGHIAICISRQLYYAHRLAVLYMTGLMPTEEVDHIDGDGTNNRWNNLRCVSRVVNGRNCRQKANLAKSGESCVYWRPDRGYYQVKVRTSTKRITVSGLSTIEAAVIVRNNLWKENGYHNNHNRKASRKRNG